jgi:hypothetical protein
MADRMTAAGLIDRNRRDAPGGVFGEQGGETVVVTHHPGVGEF